ncbi:MAG: ComEC/Rec2 family competence protein [Candidatus Latescibacterota bacterium]|nr:MAG: ComEC/Rec2 family competence protein [Candidatus Latescibacterota bacterium]
MVWGLAAALASGITRDVRFLAAALLFFGWFVHRSGSTKRQSVALAVLAVLFFFYGYLTIRAHEQKMGIFKSLALGSADPICLDGWVSSFPRYRYGGMSFVLTTHLDDLPTEILVRTKEYFVQYGDSLSTRGRIYRQRPDRQTSYARYLCGRGLVGEVRVPPAGVSRADGQNGGWLARLVFWPIHDRIRRELVMALGARAGLPVALLLGERGYLDRGTRDAFTRLGISHLLALSGLHLGFVAGFLLIVWRLLRFRNRFLLIVPLSAYVGVVGFIISLTRALVMAVLLIVASVIHRPLNAVAALGNAFVLILLFRPWAFYSVGFQLSFLATYAVLLCVSSMDFKKGKDLAGRIWQGIRSSLLVSASAQLWVAPIILHYFGRVSLLSPISTLVFVFPVAFLLLGSGLCVGLAIVWPAAGNAAFGGLDLAVRVFDAILERAELLSPARVALPEPNIYLYYTGVVMLFYARQKRWRKTAAVVLMLVAFVLSYGA